MNSRTGFFKQFRSRLFGELDPIETQLKEISHQGTGMARAAHMCALMLILLFSLGSLVALGGDALASIVSGWNRGQVDIPSAISLAVSTLLVLCMDVGMVYAASMLRRLAARRADPAEKRLHQAVMAVVAVLEAGTYAYMSARYEHPANLVVWMLILARAAAAPLLSVYLSMARTIPVSSRDILYQAELAAGKGVLQHVTRLANNPEAKLSDLLLMFHAAGDMSESDRQRLSDLVLVAQLGRADGSAAGAVFGSEQGPTFPTGGGTPVQITEVQESDEEPGNVVALERNVEHSVAVPFHPAARRTVPGRRVSGRRYPNREAERAAGFALLDGAGWSDKTDRPAMSKAEFQRRLKINNARANELYVQWDIEHRSQRVPATPGVDQDVAQ